MDEGPDLNGRLGEAEVRKHPVSRDQGLPPEQAAAAVRPGDPAPSQETRGGPQPATGRGLRTYLAALVLAVLLPSLGLGAATAWHMAGNYRTAFEERLSATAQALALALDREVQAHVAALTTLAASPRLDEEDLSGFYAHARGAAEAIGTPVVVIGADLRQRMHTERPYGSPLPVTNAPEAVRAVLATGRPAVSDLLVGAVLRTPVVTVAVPVLRGGRADVVLTAPLAPARLSGLLVSQGLGDAAFATLTDGRNVVVARSRDAAAFLGRPAPGWFLAATAGRQAGLLKGHALAGHDVILAFRRLTDAPDWTVVVAEPLAAYEASWRRPLLAFEIGAAATLLLALIAAAWLGRHILRPVRALERQADAVVASGGDAPVPEGAPTRIAEFEGLRRSFRRADAAIRARVAEAAAGEARLRAVVDTASDAIVVIDGAGVIQSFNSAAEVIFGYAAAEAVGRNIYLLLGAEHGGRHDDYLAAYLRTGERRIIGIGREVEGRRKDGSTVSLDLSIAEWHDAGGKRFFTGIMRDISARKADEARRTLLAREVDHRAKNALAVVQSVLRLTPRDDPGTFASAVEARVAALARVHSLLAEGGWSGADLRAVAERELAPYAPARPGQATAVLLDGPTVALAPTAVQPLAMVLHELATNAAKHGALSAPGGCVEVRWRAGRRAGEDGLLHLRWAETRGPPVSGAPARRGFGMRVIEATVRGQLGGALGLDWASSGLVVEITVPLVRFVEQRHGATPVPDLRGDQRSADAAMDARQGAARPHDDGPSERPSDAGPTKPGLAATRVQAAQVGGEMLADKEVPEPDGLGG